MIDINKLLKYPYLIDISKENNIHLTSIIILTYNQLKYTKLCIESIRKFTYKNRYELIVVDNNSTDGTVSWLKEQDDIKLILNNENYGVAKGWNQGIELSKGENILLLNNDVIVTPNWLYNLDSCLWSNSEIGAVSCLSNHVSNKQRIEVGYSDITSMLDFASEFNIQDSRKYESRDKLIGFCLLIKREVINKVGLLDEQFFPGNFEDDDYCMRILEAKYKLVLSKDTFIHHFGNISFKNNDLDYKKILRKNKEKFKKKWVKISLTDNFILTWRDFNENCYSWYWICRISNRYMFG